MEQALEYFDSVPAISRKLHTLVDVGLSLHPPGPERHHAVRRRGAARRSSSQELSRRSTGRTLYILDEPTTGLHFRDIELLLKVLNQLVDAGNTVLIIEHNLDVIKTADWLVDMGPEGGDGGGRVVAQGTPEAVADTPDSHTGRYLRRVLGVAHATPPVAATPTAQESQVDFHLPDQQAGLPPPAARPKRRDDSARRGAAVAPCRDRAGGHGTANPTGLSWSAYVHPSDRQ